MNSDTAVAAGVVIGINQGISRHVIENSSVVVDGFEQVDAAFIGP